MLRRVALERTDVSEELSASITRVTRIGELVTLAVTSNRRTLRLTLFLLRIGTSQDTHLWASTACYNDSFTFLHVDDVRTSWKTLLWAFMASYGNRLIVHM
jgi:hypothetical protein